MSELTPERQELQRVSREKVMAYIAREALHAVAGTYDADDEPKEGKN
jgi:hypothetical protein